MPAPADMRRSASVVNLTFHGIGDPKRLIRSDESRVWISTEQFYSILDAICARPNVRVTFDDGNSSDLDIALPALLRRGLNASFFVLAGRLNQPGSLSTSGLRTLVASGMRVGLHGMNHVPWRGLDEIGLRSEVVEARKRLEDAIGQGITWAAFPFGAYGRRAVHRLRLEGFARAYTSDRGPAKEDAWMQA